MRVYIAHNGCLEAEPIYGTICELVAQRKMSVITDPHARNNESARNTDSGVVSLNQAGRNKYLDQETTSRSINVPFCAGISIGGDGTFLRMARDLKNTGTPLFGVNMGRMGFLVDIEPEDIVNLVENIVKGEYTEEKRLPITASVQRGGKKIHDEWAVNEITIERKVEGKVVDIEVFVDGCRVMDISCNGIIIATATGSTAYSFSSGGPIVWPEMKVTLVVPVSPHELFAKPIVLPDNRSILLKVTSRDNKVVLCSDGQVRLCLQSGDEITCHVEKVPVVFGRVKKGCFAEHLVKKFNLQTA
ncbi:NAD(+)/NADH kinase [Tropheryma whipplei]|uniref:NAD(+)/NADH kinase n=1 Tax=Tropheryma whipplei TaxID=2039 RepID=UPI0004AF7B14|nr:NAD(+)/NADH kinase [Tropheryma whipplei]